VFKKCDLNGDKVIDTAEFEVFMNSVSAHLRMQSHSC
jgi:hypothetical protein